MKIAIGLSGAILLLAGCVHQQPASQGASAIVGQSPQPIIQPDFRPSGEVIMVNAEARFVVLSFPPGRVPQPGSELKIYRNGLMVGEVRVSGPQHENNTVADVVAGDVQLHDQAREE